MSNDPSLADRFVLVMAEIEREIPMVKSDDPHFYVLMRLRRSAQQALSDGISAASRIADAAYELRRQSPAPAQPAQEEVK